jgi:hypothetical protein
VITFLTIAMVSTALLAWHRTGRAAVAAGVVLLFMLVAFAAGLIP